MHKKMRGNKKKNVLSFSGNEHGMFWKIPKHISDSLNGIH